MEKWDKRKWYGTIGSDPVEVIECSDSGSRLVWVKFEPVDKSRRMEVSNILVQPEKVTWEYRNSHFETIEGNKKGNYYRADSAGSLRLDSATTYILKDAGSKVIVFPLDRGGSLSVLNYTQAGGEFAIEVNKPIWVGYVISGSGSISPVKKTSLP
jgi:hypothetical protein